MNMASGSKAAECSLSSFESCQSVSNSNGRTCDLPTLPMVATDCDWPIGSKWSKWCCVLGFWGNQGQKPNITFLILFLLVLVFRYLRLNLLHPRSAQAPLGWHCEVSAVSQNGQTTLALEGFLCVFSSPKRAGWDGWCSAGPSKVNVTNMWSKYLISIKIMFLFYH